MIIITIGISILVREAALMLLGRRRPLLPYFTGNEISALSVRCPRLAPGPLEPGGLRGRGRLPELSSVTMLGRRDARLRGEP